MIDLVCIESPFVCVVVGVAEVTPSVGAAAVFMRAVRHSLATMSPLPHNQMVMGRHILWYRLSRTHQS